MPHRRRRHRDHAATGRGEAAEAPPGVGPGVRRGRSPGAAAAPEEPDFPLSVKRRRSGSAPERKVNCVLVGDGAVGKTSLVVSYTTNGYPTEYVPTAFDNFTGNDELERIRPLCYKNADVFLLCYSVVRPCSFRNLIDRWVPEIRQHSPGAPLILVGTQMDLKEDVQVLIQLAKNHERPVDTEEGQRLAQEIGAASFAECSALTQKNLKDAFDSAILASIQQTDSSISSSGGGGSVQQQRLTLKRKTPDKIKSLSETWWRKINCLMGEQSCEFK
ncbi:hypothetical protein INR49_001867 [Caranx melampygus]|nr:hypothetical protein INR49_001867 [Caranx melampygus]